MDPAFPEYRWIVVGGFLCCMAYAFLIGANDVANAFASSVSSKSLTLKQAVFAASIFEFSGAFLLGASVTGTIRSKIIDIDQYTEQPELLMFGMFTALLTASIMLYTATYMGLPVSTTHDIVGSIMGFSIAAKGLSSVEWDVAKKLFLSWFTSPVISGTVGFIFFALVKYCVMMKEDAFHRAFYTFPIVLFIGFGVNTFYSVCE
jgi:solute carrier family 20 (sodium-dependent phosphate transporter)